MIETPFLFCYFLQIISQLPLKFPQIQWFLCQAIDIFPFYEFLEFVKQPIPHFLSLALFVVEQRICDGVPVRHELLDLCDDGFFLRE